MRIHPSRYFADVSSNNAIPDCRAYAEAGHLILAVKATEGTGYSNPDWQQTVARAHAADLAVWHYHFARPDHNVDVEGEAVHFANTVEHLIGRRDRLVLDLEVENAGGPEHLAQWAHDFDVALNRRNGHNLILYGSSSYLSEMGAGAKPKSGHVWVADYADHLTKPSWLRAEHAWQFTDGQVGPRPHQCAGVGQCDVSILPAGVAKRYAAGR